MEATAGGAAAMAEMDLAGFVGRPTVACVVIVDRAIVSAFAEAVLDDNPVFRNREVATAAGFASQARKHRLQRGAPERRVEVEQRAPGEVGSASVAKAEVSALELQGARGASSGVHEGGLDLDAHRRCGSEQRDKEHHVSEARTEIDHDVRLP